MSGGALTRSHWTPWAGAAAGAVGWVLNQQVPADVLYWNCTAGGATLGAVVGLLTALLAVLGGVVSWRARPSDPQDSAAQARKTLGEINAMAAGIFLLAIAAQTLAAFIVPECHR